MKIKKKKNDTDEYFQIRYLDIVRLIDSSDFNRLQQLASKVDLNALQSGNKPFLFRAIEKDDKEVAKKMCALFLDLEIDFKTQYSIEITDENGEKLILNNTTPFEYAKYLNKTDILDLLNNKMKDDSLTIRWLKIVTKQNMDELIEFQEKFKNPIQLKEHLNLGLIKAAEISSFRLIDYFIIDNQVDVNCLCVQNGLKVTPLLQAIAYNKVEIAKYLIFRKGDINIEGEYGDALVTAVHYESPNNLIRLLLEKGASLASRHRFWPNINLREYCVQMNKVKAKAVIDDFVLKMISDGEYEKLKFLTDNGYLNINVKNQFHKSGKDIAFERNHLDILELINMIEEKQRRKKTKMNY